MIAYSPWTSLYLLRFRSLTLLLLLVCQTTVLLTVHIIFLFLLQSHNLGLFLALEQFECDAYQTNFYVVKSFFKFGRFGELDLRFKEYQLFNPMR